MESSRLTGTGTKRHGLDAVPSKDKSNGTSLRAIPENGLTNGRTLIAVPRSGKACSGEKSPDSCRDKQLSELEINERHSAG
jgi:hypothetical protein